MILIENKKLSKIRDKYCEDVRDVILSRIKEIILLIAELRKLKSKREVSISFVEGTFDVFNRGQKGLMDGKGVKTKIKLVEKLVPLYEDITKNVGKYDNIINALNHLSDPDVILKILKSNPKELKNVQAQTELDTKLPKTDILFNYLFGYDEYYEKYIKKIASDLKVNVCPYCNRNYITHIQDITGHRIVGPTYDHFFLQADNPILAVSFYNLIPSCHPCNSNLKHEKDFDYDTHLHPYFHQMEGFAHFDFELEDKPKRNKINFTPKIKITAASGTKEYERLEGTGAENTGSLKVFKLHEIYATHDDIVEEIHEKFDQNSKYYLKSLKDIFNQLNSNEEEHYRYHFGNYFATVDFNKRPLSKLTKDIYNKMKGIYAKNKGYKTDR